MGVRYQGCGDLGSPCGVLGTALVQPTVMEHRLSLRRAKITAKKMVAIPGAKLLLKFVNQLLRRAIRRLHRLACGVASEC